MAVDYFVSEASGSICVEDEDDITEMDECEVATKLNAYAAALAEKQTSLDLQQTIMNEQQSKIEEQKAEIAEVRSWWEEAKRGWLKEQTEAIKLRAQIERLAVEAEKHITYLHVQGIDVSELAAACKGESGEEKGG